MNKIKLAILAEFATMLVIANSENGFIKLIGLAVLVILGLATAALIEKRFNEYSK